MVKRFLPVLLILALLVISCGCTQNAAPAPASPATTVPAPGTPVPSMVGATSSPSAAATGGYMDVSPAEAKDLIAAKKDLVIVDVSPYYAKGHLPGAISIPLATLDGKIPSLDRTKPYLVYCHGDSPSIAGAQKLAAAGFSPVYRLKGNYAAWVAAGYPVET